MHSRRSVHTKLSCIPDVGSSDIWFLELVLMLCSESQPHECHFHHASCAAGFPHTHMMRVHSLCLQHCPFHDYSFHDAVRGRQRQFHSLTGARCAHPVIPPVLPKDHPPSTNHTLIDRAKVQWRQHKNMFCWIKGRNSMAHHKQ